MVDEPRNEKLDQALLEALRNQAVRVPFVMTVVILIIAGFAYQQTAAIVIICWVSVAIFMQILRSTIIVKLPGMPEKTPGTRLKLATLLSLGNGIVLASSVFLLNTVDDASRAAFSMIMAGVCAGTIATTHGYRPIFTAFVVPVLGSVIYVWLQSASTHSLLQTTAICFLIIAFGSILYGTSRDVYSSFVELFALSHKLENALAAEQAANAAKTRFLAAASHDLRQPLHTLSMLSAALTLRKLDERSAEIAERINLTMEDLSSELDSLLDISKLDASIVHLDRSEFNVNASVQRLLAEYANAAETKGITLHHEACENLSLYTDKILFERLVRNLIDNAIKYTEQGAVCVTSYKHEDSCQISISDTGIGISVVEQKRVWEEFYQIENPERDRKKGLGLGLSIVARLAELLGGSIHMMSAENQGSCFTIYLPLTRSEQFNDEISVPPSGPTGQLMHYRFNATRVLVLDDDYAVQASTRILLESCGCTVFEARSTQEACHILIHEAPEIALCDLRLPKADDGFEAMKQLHALQADLPIIIVSGETAPEQLRQADLSGVGFVTKPVDPRELLQKMHDLLLGIDR